MDGPWLGRGTGTCCNCGRALSPQTRRLPSALLQHVRYGVNLDRKPDVIQISDGGILYYAIAEAENILERFCALSELDEVGLAGSGRILDEGWGESMMK